MDVALPPCTLALAQKDVEARVFGNRRALPLEKRLLLAREEILQQMSMEKSPTLYTLMPLFCFEGFFSFGPCCSVLENASQKVGDGGREASKTWSSRHIGTLQVSRPRWGSQHLTHGEAVHQAHISGWGGGRTEASSAYVCFCSSFFFLCFIFSFRRR